MGVWRKTSTFDSGKLWLEWRHQSASRFLSKIFTWILTGYVFGIFTSILLNQVGLYTIAQDIARVVFFAVFAVGVTGAFFENMVYGQHFQISENGLLQLKPLLGFERMTRLPFYDKPFGLKLEYLNWTDIRKISSKERSLRLQLMDDDTNVDIDVDPVISFVNYKPDGTQRRAEARKRKFGLFVSDTALADRVVQTAINRVRELKRQQGHSNT